MSISNNYNINCNNYENSVYKENNQRTDRSPVDDAGAQIFETLTYDNYQTSKIGRETFVPHLGN